MWNLPKEYRVPKFAHDSLLDDVGQRHQCNSDPSQQSHESVSVDDRHVMFALLVKISFGNGGMPLGKSYIH